MVSMPQWLSKSTGTHSNQFFHAAERKRQMVLSFGDSLSCHGILQIMSHSVHEKVEGGEIDAMSKPRLNSL